MFFVLSCFVFVSRLSCVLKAALAEMRFPGVLCVAMPVATGLVFRWVGSLISRPMLGAEVSRVWSRAVTAIIALRLLCEW